MQNSLVTLEETLYNLASLRQNITQFLYQLRLANKFAYDRRDNVNAEMLYEQIK